MAELTGRTLKHRYRIEAALGRGGMAEVYRAFDTRRNYAVAVKVLREDLAEDWDFVRRFQAEADSLARLAHQNIVRFYSFEQDGRTAFIVMDLIEGDTLRGRLFEAQGRPLAPAQALPIVRQVAAALAYAHSEGLIHRDVKPGNIMLRPDGAALLSDFGIAKAADAATVTTMAPGTPAYMSPEQCRGAALDARTDVYSLGVVLYEMLAGRRPFSGQLAPETVTGGTHERVRWEQMHADPPDPRGFNPALTAGIAAVILRALAKEPAARYPSVLALVDALEAACSPGRVSQERPPVREMVRPLPPAAPLQPSQARPRGRAVLAALVVVLAAVVLGGTAFAVGRSLRGAGPLAAAPVTARASLVPIFTSVAVRTTAVALAPEPTASRTPTATAAVTHTPSRAPSRAPTGTLTATPRPSDTPLPSATPTAPGTPFVRIGGATMNVRAGPGTNYPVVGQAPAGQDYAIAARNEDGSWLRLTGTAERWLSTALVDATTADLAGLPVGLAPPTPTPRPRPHLAMSGRIAFARNEGGMTAGIYVMNPDGSNPTRLMTDPASNGTAAWSPDGTRLAFEAREGQQANIFVMNADGSGRRRITSNPVRDIEPSWSPDGQLVAYSSNQDAGVWQIVTIRPDGSDRRQLTADASLKSLPFWSPDGRWIGFSSMGRGGDWRPSIYVIGANGVGEKLLLGNIGIMTRADWSPDGSRIVFDSDHESKWGEIYIVNSDGTGLRRITDNPGFAPGPGTDVPGGNNYPAWSPDGSRIVFASRRAVKPGIYTMNPDGSDQVWLAEGIGPQWLKK